jgi:hypothetical protein
MRGVDNRSAEVVVSDTPFENIYPSRQIKPALDTSVQIQVGCTIVRLRPDDLDEYIRKQLSQFYAYMNLRIKREALSKARSIYVRLQQLRTRNDILKILREDYMNNISHEYGQAIGPWLERHSLNFEKP